MPAQTSYLFNQRYRIREESLGDSGRNIFFATDSLDNAEVMIKEISVPLKKVTTTAHQEAIRQNFSKYARMLVDLEHASLVRVRNYFSDVGRHYLVMDPAKGSSLAASLGGNGTRPPLGTLLSWLDQVLDGVNYLHNQSPPVNNNCLEPRNLLLTEDGRLLLTAFGVADDLNGVITTETCESGDSLQSLNYKPLEEIWKRLDAASKKVIASRFPDDFEAEANSPSDVRSDIYSAAAVFYHLLTGHLPVDALERAIDLLDGKPDPFTPPNTHEPSLPVEISDSLTKALSIRRDDRFSTPSFMRQVLKTAVARIRERGEGEILGDEPNFSKARAESQPKTSEIGQILESGRAVNPLVSTIPSSLIETVSEMAPSSPVTNGSNNVEENDWDEMIEPLPSVRDDDFSLSYANENKPSGFGFKWLAAAAGVIVIVGAGAFFLLRPGSGDAIQKEQSSAASTVSIPAPSPTPEPETPVPMPSVSEEKIEAAPDIVTTEVPLNQETESTAAKSEPERPTRQASVKQAAPQKKKVTVDDLINDN